MGVRSRMFDRGGGNSPHRPLSLPLLLLKKNKNRPSRPQGPLRRRGLHREARRVRPGPAAGPPRRGGRPALGRRARRGEGRGPELVRLQLRRLRVLRCPSGRLRPPGAAPGLPRRVPPEAGARDGGAGRRGGQEAPQARRGRRRRRGGREGGEEEGGAPGRGGGLAFDGRARGEALGWRAGAAGGHRGA